MVAIVIAVVVHTRSFPSLVVNFGSTNNSKFGSLAKRGSLFVTESIVVFTQVHRLITSLTWIIPRIKLANVDDFWDDKGRERIREPYEPYIEA